MNQLIFVLSLLCYTWITLGINLNDLSLDMSFKELNDDAIDYTPIKQQNNFLSHFPTEKLQGHGTTTLAFIHKEGVIVAVDSMASIGSYVGSRTVRKVFKMSDHIVATMAGGAADCTYWIRRTAANVKLLEFDTDGQPLPVSVYAKILADSLREYRGSGISVGTMVAGWHPSTGPTVHYVDSEGLCVPGHLFSVGSGSMLAYSIIDSQWKDIQSKDDINDVIHIAVSAIRHASYRDSYSGGYINILYINKSGIHHMKRIDSRSIDIISK